MGVSSDSDKSEPPGGFQGDLCSLWQNNRIALGGSEHIMTYIEL